MVSQTEKDYCAVVRLLRDIKEWVICGVVLLFVAAVVFFFSLSRQIERIEKKLPQQVEQAM